MEQTTNPVVLSEIWWLETKSPRRQRYLGRLLLVGELSAPQDAALRGDQQEAVSAVQRPRRGLDQTNLDAPPTCRRPTPTLKRTPTGQKPGVQSFLTFDVNQHQGAEGRAGLGCVHIWRHGAFRWDRMWIRWRRVLALCEGEHEVRRLNDRQETSRTAGPTSLFLAPLLSSCVDPVPHVVLQDVLSGCQSPQGVSGALSPTGRANRSPVLCHSWAESANEHMGSKNKMKRSENKVKKKKECWKKHSSFL